MFICNFKVNGSKIFKYFFMGIIVLLILIFAIVSYKIFSGANTASKSKTCIPNNEISKIQAKNYTNILKAVHENINPYVGKKICFTGYVYRVLDLQDNQFVLARDMIVNSNSQTVVVGFLCELENGRDFENNTWVELTGEIKKGDYHGDMPIIKVTEIHKVDCPSEEYVYPPDDSYIPTSGIL